MHSIIFDGKEFAKKRELLLIEKIRKLQSLGRSPSVKTFTFEEDEGSRLYTKLKHAAASRIGILYEPIEVSLHDDIGLIIQSIRELSFDSHISGIMIQKPAKSVWIEETGQDPSSFDHWWGDLVTAIDPKKDVDCLTPTNLERIFSSRVIGPELLLPATVKAVLMILDEARTVLEINKETWVQKKVLVLGKSDIVGKPLAHVLRKQGHTVNNVGRKELPYIQAKDYSIIISAAGSPNVVTGDMVSDGAVVIDVGSPTNDVERASVERKAAFLTPVPGGVGPVTVVSLMENILTISS